MLLPPRAAAWLAASAAVTALSFNLRTAPLATWLHAPCALSAWFAVAVTTPTAQPCSPEATPWLRFALLFVAAQALASTTAFWGVLQGPGVPPLAGHAALLPLTAALWAFLLVPPHALHVAFARCFPASPAAVLVFPAAWTATWTLIGALSPLGAFASPASTQAAWRPVAQLAALLGGDGIVFLTAWPGAALSTAAAGVLAPRAHARRHVAASLAAIVAALVFGSLRLATAPQPAGASLRVACVLRVEDAVPALPEQALWQRTHERIAAGDDLVLWSETALAVSGAAGEAALLARAADAAAAGGSYLGVTYELDAGDDATTAEPSLNVFALLRPGRGARNASTHGAVAFRYVKGHVVPLVEAGFAAGPSVLALEPAPWGATSAAICFDSDFPALMRQAGQTLRAALVLQPSQTWGPARFRERHFLGNGLRAVENGYTLLRCSSEGVSGALGPRLERFAWSETGAEGLALLTVPQPAPLRADTAYARRGGWLFGWACVAAAVAAAAAVLVSESSAAALAHWRRGGSAPQDACRNAGEDHT